MSTPVNLNKIRKAKARAQKKARAAENVVRFGRSKSEKELDKAHAQKAQDHLDQTHRKE
ncbi:DUF4169 family protein [Roseovarius aestuariivivens]|uniref:DUF4169 family protein n=1 Tax=Roseovarius aestuariivivens TaxID=1888910 RepID=UPI0010813857|nr:DUF4169 family protein [Roseovarius aestuariivivens]